MAKVLDVLDGLAILAKYKREGQCDAQHDVLYRATRSCASACRVRWVAVGVLADGPEPDQLDGVDRAALATLGWAYDHGFSSWRRFT